LLTKAYHMSKSLWGELPSTSNSSVGLSETEKDALRRLSRPLPLKGPKIYQPEWVATADKAQPGRQGESILARCIRLRLATEGKEPDAVALVAAAEPIILKRTGPFGVGMLDDDDHEDEEEPTAKMELDGQDESKPITKESRGHGRRRSWRRLPPTRPLDASQAHAKLRRAVAEVMAAVGYDTASERALQAATDVVGQTMRTLGERIRTAAESGGGCGRGFSDPLERALAECRLASAVGIKAYVEEDLLGLHSSLVEKYRSTLAPVHAGPQSVALPASAAPLPSQSRMYLISSLGEDVPELHLPSSEEGELMHLENATPQLETGLQMLQSLEQGSLGSGQNEEDESEQAVAMVAATSPTLTSAGGDFKRKKRS